MGEGDVESHRGEQDGDNAEADSKAEQQLLSYERPMEVIGQREDAPHHVRGISPCDV
jgi:hypothetical protein